jgi:alkanesulfonate monooxygenase SsuD/methylene tetrahydromethanopterin reductase-like flavin-dependent oxidoreductase (luciferase family)
VSRRDKPAFGIAYGPQWEGAYTGGFSRRSLIELVQAVEELGFDSFWLMDHPALAADCWTNLAACAVLTTRVQLGTLASCVFYRPPALLARLAIDLDQLSGGRLVLGLGTGDSEAEFEQLGMHLPTARERRYALDETLQILKGAWGDVPASVTGQQFSVVGFRVTERSVRQPCIPVLIAGGGERVTLQRVAEHADMANMGPHSWTGSAFEMADVRRKWTALRGHCQALGRPYESVLRSHVALPVVVRPSAAEARVAYEAMHERVRTFFAPGALVGGTKEIVGTYLALRDAGFQYFIAALYGPDFETARLLAEQVAPAVAS